MTDKERLSNESERPEARAPEASPLPYYCLTTPAWKRLAVVRRAASIPDPKRRRLCLAMLCTAFAGGAGSMAGWYWLRDRYAAQPEAIDVGATPDAAALLAILVPISRSPYVVMEQELIGLLDRLQGEKARQLDVALDLIGTHFARSYPGLPLSSCLIENPSGLKRAEGVLAALMKEKQTGAVIDRALDIIYQTLVASRHFDEALIGRPYSVSGKRCVYWDDYELPPTKKQS